MIQRIDYIDRMKGLAIFLVVLGHVYYYAFERSNSILSAFVGSFSYAFIYVFIWACRLLWSYPSILEFV